MAATYAKIFTPVELERQLTSVMYMLIKMRLSQKRTAKHLGISEAAVGQIVKRHNLKDKIKEAKNQGIKNNLKFDDSLTAFVVNRKIKSKEFYKQLETEYKDFLNTL